MDREFAETPLPVGIFIFTYNRAPLLARTLEQFAASPFRDCSITVLDNHSTDETPKICAQFEANLPGLRTVRHPKNIGADANYLRAVELSQAEYTWAVCDDDDYDFSRAGDVTSALAQRRVDLISLGVADHELPGGYQGRTLEFALAHPFFISHSFVPSLIFKTALFDSEVLRKAYNNIDALFPQFPLMASAVERNVSIYVSREKVIRKGTASGYSAFRFLIGWVKSCRKISQPQVRSKAASEVFGGKRLVVNLLYCLVTERALRRGQFRRQYRELCAEASLLSFWLAFKILLFLPLVLAPNLVHRALWRSFKRYRERKGMPVPNLDEVR